MTAVENVELVIFEVGGNRYGADLTQVLRLDKSNGDESLVHPLGTPVEGNRALVIEGASGEERQLVIDHLLGVQTVPRTELRQLPAPARVSSDIPIGAWLDGDTTVLLVDLAAIVQSQPVQDPSHPE